MKLFKLIFMSLILTSTGCIALKPLQPVELKPNASVLYVFREDSMLSGSDKIIIYLNNKKATELTDVDGYKALILKSGTYTIKFDVFNKEEKLIKQKDFSSVIEPNRAYMVAIAYNFGWGGFDRFFEAEGKSVFRRFQFKGEVDLTEVISPK